jgi:nucleoside-diphosphate-sugar epimerase
MSGDFSYLRNRRILATGASGFIGSQLRGRLAENRVALHAVSRTVQRDDAQCRWWQADLEDFARVSEIVSTIRPEVIFHLASHVSGSRDLGCVRPTLNSNLVSTVNLLIAAAECGCPRIVLAGSLEEPAANAVVPCSPYAAAKWAARGYARMFSALYGIQTIHLRIAMVYGPGQADSSKLIPYVIRSLLHGESPKVSSGRRAVDWIFVDDVVDALLAAAVTRDDGCMTLDIGSGTTASVREIVEQLCQLVEPTVQPLFGSVEDRLLESTWVADTAQAEERIGWQSRTQLPDGLRKTVDWYLRAEGVG